MTVKNLTLVDMLCIEATLTATILKERLDNS